MIGTIVNARKTSGIISSYLLFSPDLHKIPLSNSSKKHAGLNVDFYPDDRISRTAATWQRVVLHVNMVNALFDKAFLALKQMDIDQPSSSPTRYFHRVTLITIIGVCYIS